MLIDTHVHSKPDSRCSWVLTKDIPALFKNAGFGGFMLTNHFYEDHLNQHGDDYHEQIKCYINTYKEAKAEADNIGIKAFFGAEVRVTDTRIDENGNSVLFRPEFILIGLTEEKLLNSPILYKLTQKELYEYANQNDILIYQAHPYRVAQGYRPANPQYTHGIEVFNGHPNFPPMVEETLKIATDNDLLMSAGSDMHIERQAGLAGIDVPSFIDSALDLAAFLKENKPKKFNKDKLIIEF